MSKPSIGNLTEQSAKISVLKNESWMGKHFYIDEHHVLQKQANGLFKKGHVRVCNTPRATYLTEQSPKLFEHTYTQACGAREVQWKDQRGLDV